jgi:hypothetical protein
MDKRIPASMRTRQSLCDLIEGRLSLQDERAELVRLATRLIVEEAVEGESRDAIGRGYYEHGPSPGQEYRNGLAANPSADAHQAELSSSSRTGPLFAFGSRPRLRFGNWLGADAWASVVNLGKSFGVNGSLKITIPGRMKSIFMGD